MGTLQNHISDRSLSAVVDHMGLPHRLLPFQEHGVAFLLSTDSALLADEMGLGKTVQTIVALRALMDAGAIRRVLIVAPRSLLSNWASEFSHWAPDVLCCRAVGNASNRAAYYYLPVPILLVSYEQVRQDSDSFDQTTPFDVVVLDEGQRIKNQSCMTSLACRGLARRRSWLLTGTPVENTSEDLLALFTFLRRGLLHEGMSIAELQERIKPHFLRRRKIEVLDDLPAVIDQEVEIDLCPEQRQKYRQLLKAGSQRIAADGQRRRYANMLALLTALKQVCNFDSASGCSSKLDALRMIFENAEESGFKVLVFSQYVRTLDWLRVQLPDIDSRVYHGQLDEEQRDEILNWYRSATASVTLLMSLRAGGVGLNLPETDVVVLFDRWWNPAVEKQAIHRAHRLNRTKPLHIVRFVSKHTVEERIASLLKQKQYIFEHLVEAAESAEIRTLSADRLRWILSSQ